MVSDKDVQHLGLAGTCLWRGGATGRACGGKRESDAHNRRDLVTAYNCVTGLRASAGGGAARCGLVPRRPAGAEAMRCSKAPTKQPRACQTGLWRRYFRHQAAVTV